MVSLDTRLCTFSVFPPTRTRTLYSCKSSRPLYYTPQGHFVWSDWTQSFLIIFNVFSPKYSESLTCSLVLKWTEFYHLCHKNPFLLSRGVSETNSWKFGLFCSLFLNVGSLRYVSCIFCPRQWCLIYLFIGRKFEKYFGIHCKLPVKYYYLIGV